MEFVDQAARSNILDASTLSTFLSELEQATVENFEQREKHEDQPEKFFDSEANLYEIVAKVEAIPVDIDLFAKVVQDERFIPTLFPLLTHPNFDIVEVILRFLLEATDTNITTTTIPLVGHFVEALKKVQIYGILLETVVDLEVSQSDATEKFSLILELLASLLYWENPNGISASEALVEGWPIFLLNCLSEMDLKALIRSNCAEILLGLISASEEIKKVMVTNGSFNQLLMNFNKLADDELESIDEQELCNNICDTICTLLLDDNYHEIFIQGRGIEICLNTIQYQKYSCVCAIRILFFFLSSDGSCKYFVNAGGLKCIFPLFMGMHHVELGKRYPEFNKARDLEYICSIIANLFRFITAGTSEHKRLKSKFVEREFEKTHRLVFLIKSNSMSIECQRQCALIAIELAYYNDQADIIIQILGNYFAMIIESGEKYAKESLLVDDPGSVANGHRIQNMIKQLNPFV